MPKILVDEQVLIDAFSALQAEGHYPDDGVDCDKCAVLGRIERVLGRQLTDERSNPIEALEPLI